VQYTKRYQASQPTGANSPSHSTPRAPSWPSMLQLLWVWPYRSTVPVTTSAQSGGKRPPVVGTAHPTTGQRGGCIFCVLVSTCATSALVDTGSPVSFLSHRYFQKVASVAHNVANIGNVFRAVNSSKFACDLCCDIVIVIDGREVKCHFFVSKALCDFDMILGRSFLQTGFTLTFTQEEVSLTSHPPRHTTTKGQATDSDTNPVTCSLTQPNPLRIGQGQNNVCPKLVMLIRRRGSSQRSILWISQWRYILSTHNASGNC